jgi:hypothetical protein
LTSSALFWSEAFKLLESVVQGNDVGRATDIGVQGWRKLLAPSVAAAFRALFSPGALDKNSPHRLGGSSKEVASTIPLLFRIRVCQPQVGLVNESSGRQSVS